MLFLIIIPLSIYEIKKKIDIINYQKTYEYKFTSIGYTIEEANTFDKLNDDNKDYLLTLEYDANYTSLLSQKYFIEKNLKKYIEYENKEGYSISDIIAIVNTGVYNAWYSDTKKTDTSKGNLMITNKFYSLDSTYNDDNIIQIEKQYIFGDYQALTKDAYDAFIQMANDAKKENLTLIVNSSYRSYDEQEEVYNNYKKLKGEEYADSIAAKPGFSEHQTGLAIDIQTYGSTGKTFEQFGEFKWLQDNAHKYGFILRYPKGKEYLTGYDYESWHYRFVGIEAATYIKENDITFDEYYAYFVER